MSFQRANTSVFKRYNLTVAVAFFVVVIIALSVTSYLYFSELAQNKRQSLARLSTQAELLNDKLLHNVQAINGMKTFAEYALVQQNEFTWQVPSFAQDGEFFYLEKMPFEHFEQGQQLRGNITGIGDVSQFSKDIKQEIGMANALTSALIASEKMLTNTSWIYYVSANRFVNIYPWVSRDTWHFTDRLLTGTQFLMLQQRTKSNNTPKWSSPFIDAAGQELHTSLATGVYRQNDFVGTMNLDVNLASLQQNLTDITSAEQEVVLFNQKNQVLILKQYEASTLNTLTVLEDILPNELKYLNALDFGQLSDSIIIGDWLIEKQRLAIDGWTLMTFQKYSVFKAPLLTEVTNMFALRFVGLLAFLLLIVYMTSRSFINPAKQFIRHIEYSSEGNPGKIKPNADWLHWFQIVENIFSQNRTLLQQLKEQNNILDKRVIKKTKALQESSAKHQRDYVLLRSVMNAIPELIVFNDPQGRLIGCNSAYEVVAKQSEAQMMGKINEQIMPADLQRALLKLPTPKFQDFPLQYTLEVNECIYGYYCSQFISEDDEVLGTISVFRDITQAQNSQAALEKAKNQAEKANKIKSQFLANMSHEIRTPINAMQGMMDLLANTRINSSQQHYLDNAQTAAASLLHLINELLDLSKIESGKMQMAKELTNVALIVDKALTLNVAQAQKKALQVVVELDASVPEFVMSDEMRLVQVLSNLLNNAVKFTEQGEVTLRIETIALSAIDVLIRFKVIDTGIGVAKDQQAHLFDAFTQADGSMTRKYGGSGLGLSICQQIVNLLGGKISFKSQLGFGSELSFVLAFSLPNKHIMASATSPSKQVAPLDICTFNQHLSASFIDDINKKQWQLSRYQSFAEFVQHKFMLNTVLLIQADELAMLTQSSNEDASWRENIDFLALYQPAMKELSDESFHYLAQFQLPYILLDTPLYRYSLDKMAMFSQQNNSVSPHGAKANTKQYSKDMSVAASDESPNNDTRQNRTMSGALQGVKVLLVEDNLVNQLVAKELLLNMGASVIIANHGEQALECLAKEMFDVVLMDIQMPVMDGLTATKKIRQQDKYQHLAIIAMTAHARVEDKQRSLSAGMNLHIAKPVTTQILQKNILAVLKK